MASSYLRGDDLTAPLRIHADRQAGTLRIEWVDGHVSTYDFVRLRWLCPCAYCRGEMGQPGWLDSSPTLTGEQTRLVSMEPVSIGHNSDVLTHFGPNTSYSPWYFCAFKRKVVG